MNPLQQFASDIKRGFRKGEDIMTAAQVYRHSIFDKDYFQNIHKQGYTGRSKVGFTDRTGRKVGKGQKYNVAAAKNPAEFLGAYGARLTTDILSDGTRQFYWR